MPWFVKENRRAAPRHWYDNNAAWIQLEGSLIRQCQILDLSRTGVRLRVTNAHILPSTFILILSRNTTGRPVRVRWRRDTEVGAEFFDANSSSASRLIAKAPRAVSPRRGERQRSESVVSTLSLHAQGQQQDVISLKPDARNIAGSISSDGAKTDADRQVTNLAEPIVEAAQQKDENTSGDEAKTEADRQVTNLTEPLVEAANEMDLSLLQKKLGPHHVALIHALKDVDSESPHGQELASIIENLESCE